MKSGYVSDTCGHKWPFSWWRSTNEAWDRWSVLGHGPFTRDGRAVVDDFGTLVEVPV